MTDLIGDDESQSEILYPWRHYLIGPEPYPWQTRRSFYAPNLDQAFAAARAHWPTKALTFLQCEEAR